MEKLLLGFLVLSAGAIGFGSLRLAAERAQVTSLSHDGGWKETTNKLAQLTQAAVSLHNEVADKRNRLRQASHHPILSPELLAVLDGNTFEENSTGWVELREQLGIGWDSSEDYVLVAKRILKKIDFHRIYWISHATDTACGLLAISAEEQSGIEATLRHATDSARSRVQSAQSQVQRAEPNGEIVA